jgi:DNA polymerase III subunit delta
MIIKTFDLASAVLKIKDHKICLFYGENLGLMDDFKESIRLQNKNSRIIKMTQDEILKNTNLFCNEIANMSLFEKEKIFFIYNADDKILSLLEEVEVDIGENKIYLFSGALIKKSKLRSYIEKSKIYSALPCYQDDELSIKKIILEKLKGYQGLNTENINTIAASCSRDRMKLNNEIDKIKNCFIDKNIENTKLNSLLNTNTNEDLNELRDAILEGDKTKTNKLLSETEIQNEKNIFYLQVINQRIAKLSDLISLSSDTNIDQAIYLMKPPIFWKDKKNIIIQTKRLNNKKISEIYKKTFATELRIKSDSSVDQKTLIKNLSIDICNLAIS